jgi:hypothetical protein
MKLGITSLLIPLTASVGLCSCVGDADDPELTSAPVQVAADGRGVIERVEYFGDGCPEGSATSALSEDSQVVTSLFSGFQAGIGPQSEEGGQSRGCVLQVHVRVPRRWSYAVESVDVRGFVLLEDRVSAERNAVYWIGGTSPRATPPGTWTGPFEDDYTQSDVGPEAPLAWSPCGGGQNLVIAAQLNLDNQGNPEGTGLATIDSIDTELQWRRCE